MNATCKRGHPLTADNASTQRTGDGRPFTMCRQCNAERAKAWRAGKRASAPAGIAPARTTTPGSWLPPVPMAWDRIVALAAAECRTLANWHDLPGWNRARVARGEAPLCVARGGAA